MRQAIKWLTAATLNIFGVFFILQSVQAANVNMQMLITDPTGSPLANVQTALYDSSNVYVDATHSNSLGYVNYYEKAEGAYTVQVRPGQSSDCSVCSLYEDEDIAVTASTSSPGYDAETGFQTLDTLALTQASRYVTVAIIETSAANVAKVSAVGDAVSGISVSAWNEDNDSWKFGTTDSSGEFSFAVDEADESDWNVYVYSNEGLYTQASSYQFAVATTGETSINLEVIPTDAAIEIALQDANGNSFSIPTGAYGSISCYDSNYTYYFSDSLAEGETSSNVQVLGNNTYLCNAWLDGYGSSAGSVTVAVGGSESMSLKLFERSETVTVSFKNADTDELITDFNPQVYAFASADANGDPFSDYSYTTFSGGTATLDLVDGVTYDLNWWDVTESSSYVNTYQSVSFVAGETSAATLEAYKSDATIKVTVLDADGNASDSWVSAYEQTTDANAWGLSSSSQTNSNGKSNLGVVGGKTYTVSAYPTNSNSSEVLAPANQEVTIEAGESKSISMQSVTVDFQLGLEVTTSDDVELDYSYCYAYSPSFGYQSYSDDVVGNPSAKLGLVADKTWYIGCMGFADDKFYRSDDQKYKPSLSAVDDTLQISMSDAGDYYETTTYSWDGSTSFETILPDGISSISLPAGAIASSGTVTLTVGTAIGYAVNDNAYPFQVFDFTAYDSSGNQITDLNANVKLRLAYDPDELPEGLTEDDIKGGSYNESTKSWDAPISIEVNKSENVIEITLNHFSNYGALGNRGLRIITPKKPRKAVTRHVTKYNVRLTWKKPKNSTVKKYIIQLRERGERDSAVWETFNKSKKIKKSLIKYTVRKLSSNTRYQWRIRSVNKSKKSNFTDWVNFKTKR